MSVTQKSNGIIYEENYSLKADPRLDLMNWIQIIMVGIINVSSFKNVIERHPGKNQGFAVCVENERIADGRQEMYTGD